MCAARGFNIRQLVLSSKAKDALDASAIVRTGVHLPLVRFYPERPQWPIAVKGLGTGDQSLERRRMAIKCYRDLLVWQRAMDLVEECYRLTGDLPRNEEFGLKSQMRRAAVSIPSNIAEGRSRSHSAEFLHFVSISLGSLAELETQLDLTARLNLLPAESVEIAKRSCEEVGRMLHRIASAIRRSH